MHQTDLDDFSPDVCVAGNHQHDGVGRLCDRHRSDVGALIADVARQTRELGNHLMPAGSTPGEKVSTSRIGSPTPARLDVLSLIGPGGTDIRRDSRAMTPAVRRWSTVETYRVDTPAGSTTRTIRWYHSEVLTAGRGTARTCRCGQHHGTKARPLMTGDDDQVGSVPPAEWMDTWVRRWRSALQHGARKLPPGQWADYQPAGQVDTAQDKRLLRAGIGELARQSAGRPHLLKAVAAWLGLRAAYQAARDTLPSALLGLRTDGPDLAARADDALAGAQPPPVAHDPVTAEWIVRYGAARTAAAVEVDAHYLSQWLDTVALLDDDPDGPDLAAFVAELRALHTELQHVLGETRDEQWIGRCPVTLLNSDGEETGRRCGAGLWHDPHRPGWRIQCPRCHTSWPERDWLRLATRIRTAWPIDHRRRYSLADRIEAERNAAMPRCYGCERVMAVDWQPSPTRGDKHDMWRPTGMNCPAGCISSTTRAAVLAAA